MTSNAALLDDPTAINTIAVLGLSSMISVGNCLALFRRAFPKHFIANDSTIRFLSRRCQLLLLASVLLLVDASNNTAHFYYSWRYQTSYSFVASRIIYLLSFPLTAPLLTHGTCKRCAVIVSKYPEKQQRLMRVSSVACTVIACATIAGGVVVLLQSVRNHLSPSQWFATTYIPVYISWSIAGYPLLAVLASAWALSSSLRRGSNSPHNDGVTETRSIQSQTKSSSITSTALSLMRKGATTTQPGQLSYPLSSTFVLLSIANMCLWIFVMISAAAGTSTGKLRINALLNFLASLGVTIETSFEFFVRKANQRQAASWRDDVHTFGMTTAGAGVMQ